MPYFKFISFVYVGGGEQMYVYMYVVCMYRASIGVPQHGCGCQMVAFGSQFFSASLWGLWIRVRW